MKVSLLRIDGRTDGNDNFTRRLFQGVFSPEFPGINSNRKHLRLLLNGKSSAGFLCESVSYGYQQQGRGILCGIGINLAQPQSYFDAAGLPNGTSLALQGAKVDLSTDPAWLAEGLTDFGFDRNMYVFARDGFAPFREEYKAACVNLGRRVTFDLPDGGQGAGEAVDVDEEGRLVVRTDSGEVHVFTGEVSVHGIYGAV